MEKLQSRVSETFIRGSHSRWTQVPEGLANVEEEGETAGAPFI